MLKNVAVAALDDSLQEEIAVESIVSVQSYRSAAHIAFKSVADQRRTFPTDSTSRITRLRKRREAALEQVGVDAAVRGHFQCSS